MSKNHPIRAFLLQLLRAVAAAGTVVLCSRFMGAQGRGELSIVLFYINIAMVVNEFVGGSSIAGLINRYSPNRILPAAWIWIGIVTLGYMLFGFLQGKFQIWNILFVLFLGLTTIQFSIYHGTSRVYHRNVLQAGMELTKGVLVLIFFLVTNYLFTENVIQIFALVSMLGFLISSYQLRKYLKTTLPAIKPPTELFSEGFWSQSGHLVMFLNYRLVLLIIEKYSGLSDTGLYSNALLIADTIWIFANSFGMVAHMHILQSSNDKFRADITLRYAAVALVGTVVIAGLALAVPNSLYVFVFGNDFEGLKNTFVYLIPAIMSIGFATLFSHYLHATAKYKWLLLANFTALVVQIILAFILIPSIGLNGACIAADAGFIVLAIFVYFVFRMQNPNTKIQGVFRIKTLWQTILHRE